MAQSLKRASIATPCCKKRITPERRRYVTPPKETERKICRRSELCIGCPFPASGFICWGSGEDCLRSRYMKLQNREEGILQGGMKFEDVCVFQNEGCTCLLFPFTPEVQLDMGKLAVWRIRSSEQFGGMWLSDYVDIKLGGYIQDHSIQQKPDCPLIGQDGNIFNLMGIASRTLKENGLSEQAREMRQRITQCHSYDSALSVIADYVNITSVHEMDQGMDEISMT